MQLRDLITIVEAGIVTADLSRQATRVVRQTLNDLARQVIEQQTIGEEDDRTEVYDAIFQKITGDPTRQAQTAEWVGKSLSQTLTDLTRRHAAERFPNDPMSRWKVRIARQPGDETRGGYFSWQAGEIVVYFDPVYAVYGLLNMIADHLLGEPQGDEHQTFEQQLVSTYLHEYTHFEQFLRSDSPTGHDHGYVTAGIKGRARKGKRGGYHRDVSSTDGYLRYKGSHHEIDAFSSEAAYEIASSVRENDWDYNAALNYVRQGLSSGSADSPTAQHYLDLVQRAFEGAYQDLNLDPEQMRRAWKRFAKQVYLKVGAYLRPTHGKADPTDSHGMNPDWVYLAQKHPRSATVAMLAHLVADDMAIDVTASYNPDERLADAVARIPKGYATGEQADAESFLTRYYHGSSYDSEDDAAATRKVFRGLVLKFLHQRLSTVRG